MVAWMRLNVTLYVRCLPCFIIIIIIFFLEIGLNVTCPCKRVNSAFYIKVLKHLSNAIQQSRQEKMGKQLDIAPWKCSLAHLLTVQQFLVKNHIPATPNYHILQISLCAKSRSSRGSGLGIHKKKLNRPRQQVLQPAISKEDCRCASSNGRTTDPNTYTQKGRTFRVTMFHFIHILFITNYNQVPETSRSHINILLVFSFHYSCWSVDDLPPVPITLNGYTSSNFPKKLTHSFLSNHFSIHMNQHLSLNTHLLHSAETQKRPSTDPRSFLHFVTYLFIPLLMEISEENIGLLCHYDWKKETHVYTLQVLSNSNYNKLIKMNKNNYYIENVLN